MFPVDQLHALWRHSCAHNRRETIAFGRRINAMLERAHLMAVWRNFVKKITERQPDPTTAAMSLGLTERRWSWARVLARRLFPARVAVPPGWMTVYRMMKSDEGLVSPEDLHALKHDSDGLFVEAFVGIRVRAVYHNGLRQVFGA